MSTPDGTAAPAKILKTTLNIGAATALSRILGLIRVRLESAVLGGGDVASGWFLAFMIPNLFRRILGEGALATALMPLVAECEQQHGTAYLKKELGVVFCALGFLLALLVAVFSIGAAGALWFLEKYYSPIPLRLQWFLRLLPLLMPYAFFICLVGVSGAILNYTRMFVLPALGALLLNIFLIGGLSIATLRGMTAQEFLPMLGILVPVSGAIQLVLMAYLLKIQGVFPLLNKAVWHSSDILRRLWKLALPGIIGYSGLQLSFIADRSLAASLGSQAVPALTYVDRIIDVPIGIFSVSLGAVLMAEMSRAAGAGKTEEISSQLNFSLRHTLFLGVPLGVGVIFFSTPMLRLLCLGGSYTQSDLKAAEFVALFYGAGIPAFCALKAILPAFHARKKMMTTLKVSLIGVVLNIVMNLILMRPLQQGGIALATVISSLFNNLTLLWILKKENFQLGGKSLAVTAVRSTVLSLLIASGLKLVYDHYAEFIQSHWSYELVAMMIIGAVFMGIYEIASYSLKAREIGESMELIRKKRR